MNNISFSYSMDGSGDRQNMGPTGDGETGNPPGGNGGNAGPNGDG